MKKPRKVFIIEDFPSSSYHRLFQQRGWEFSHSIKDADVVQFTGGEDVSPSFYGMSRHPKTVNNLIRDKAERAIFNVCLSLKKPMAGICRGGQFLNVMCGGKLWQHINNHAIGGCHDMMDVLTGRVVKATSTHHQEMIPGPDGEVIGIAFEASLKENPSNSGHIVCRFVNSKTGDGDVEVVFYNKQSCLCFQPHPEMGNLTELQNLYFEYVNTYLLT